MTFVKQFGKNTAFWKGEFKAYLGEVCFLLPKLFQKVIDRNWRDEKHGKHFSINYIGKKTHTIW